jgi:chaperonin GroEL
MVCKREFLNQDLVPDTGISYGTREFVCGVCAVKGPGFGDRRKEMLQDIAILTGAKLFCEELGTNLENAQMEDLGRCDKVISRKDETILIGGKGNKQALEARRSELRTSIEKATSDYDREKLQERLAKLTGGVAVVRVGAASEAELKNRKEAFDDAIRATKAAVEEGIVPGGGLALLRLIAEVEKLQSAAEGDEWTGIRLLKRALEAPTRQIAENSNFDPGVVVDRMEV